MDESNIIGKRIASKLKERNMMASELAKRINVSKSTMSYYLSGRFEPKKDKIFSMAKVLMVSPFWLMGVDYSEHEIERQSIVENEEIQNLIHAYCNASEEGKAMFRKLAELYL